MKATIDFIVIIHFKVAINFLSRKLFCIPHSWEIFKLVIRGHVDLKPKYLTSNVADDIHESVSEACWGWAVTNRFANYLTGRRTDHRDSVSQSVRSLCVNLTRTGTRRRFPGRERERRIRNVAPPREKWRNHWAKTVGGGWMDEGIVGACDSFTVVFRSLGFQMIFFNP